MSNPNGLALELGDLVLVRPPSSSPYLACVDHFKAYHVAVRPVDDPSLIRWANPSRLELVSRDGVDSTAGPVQIGLTRGITSGVEGRPPETRVMRQVVSRDTQVVCEVGDLVRVSPPLWPRKPEPYLALVVGVETCRHPVSHWSGELVPVRPVRRIGGVNWVEPHQLELVQGGEQ